MCVCVCVCEREREKEGGEGERWISRGKEKNMLDEMVAVYE